MNRAIIQYRPNSSWITAGLLTVLVITFGVIAESHRPSDVPVMFTGTGVVKVNTADTKDDKLSFFKIH